MPRRRSRISMKRNASQVARAPGAVRGKGLIRGRIKLAGTDVPLNCRVELRRVEGLEPGAKPRELARGELFNGFLDVFGSGYINCIAFGREAVKRLANVPGQMRRSL
jgi:hypothetical protein